MAGGSISAAIALACALVACGGAERERPRSVVLVVIDTLRADALEGSGTAPALAELARRGTVFEDAFAAAPWTGPAVAALVTGRYPDEVGVRDLRDPLPAGATTLAQRFQRAGYATGSVVSNALAGPPYGHAKGYDFVHYRRYKEGREDPPSFRAQAVVDAALPWLEARLAEPERPFFLYLHSCDPHEPYLPVEPHRSRSTAGHEPLDDAWILAQRYLEPGLDAARLDALVAHYRGEVAAADDALGRLLARLPEDVVVAIVSDHGEAFLEHGRLLHGNTLYQELLHVPWILAGPGVPAARVAEPVSQVDLVPTLLALAGVPFDERELSGRSLLPLLSGGSLPERALHAVLEGPGRRTLAVRRGRWKLVHGANRDASFLFDLATDPGEHVDVAREHPEVVDELLALLRARLDAIVPVEAEADAALDAEREAELRAIGYAR